MRSFFAHPLMIVLITVAAIIFTISTQLSTREMIGDSKTGELLANEIAQKEARVADLEEAIRSAKDPFVAEKRLRDELLLQQPGDIPFQLPPMTAPPATIRPTPTPATPWQNWQKELF